MTTPVDLPAGGAAGTTTTERTGERMVLPGQSPAGEYILSVLLKRTFDIAAGRECTRAQEDEPLNGGDVYWDHPMNSSVRFESDLIPFKLNTDVVVNGTTYAPGGAPTRSCKVALQIGTRRRELLVVGDRQARYAGGAPPVFTDPEPFTTMPIRYERAYGGVDVYSDLRVPYPFPKNPVGCGFVVRNVAKAIDGLALPNIESPRSSVTPETLCLEEYAQWESRPVPAGFGWFAKTWMPRAALAGVLPRDRAVEQELRHAYAELVPAEHRQAYLANGFRDMDFTFFNGAPPGYALPYLTGGEVVSTENLSPAGRLDFLLPKAAVRIGIDIGRGIEEPEVVLQTVMIRMDDAKVDLVWRAAVPYEGPDWLPQMQKLDVLVS